MQGKVCVVTGANSGIGKSLATSFAQRGAEVVLVCRNEARGLDAKADIEAATGSGSVSLELCDVGDMDSVRRCASLLRARLPRIDVLCNNAGLYLSQRAVSPQGYEAMFAINHLGAFLLTNLLLDRLAGARVITTSSLAHHFARFDVERAEHVQSPLAMIPYGNSKLCNILFTRELHRRHGETLSASCFHPGAVGTQFGQDDAGLMNGAMKLGRILLRTPEQGADTGLFLATAEEGRVAEGGYYANRKRSYVSRTGRDAAIAARLWDRSVTLSGLG